jgi:signal transduction histidine kinase
MVVDLAAVLNSMVVGVFVTDAAGTVVLVNDAARTMAGAHPRTIRNEDGTPIGPDELPYRRALKGEAVVLVVEVLDDEARGKVVLRTRTSPIRDADGTIVGTVKVAVDVTREYELAGVRDEFIRQAAHELKTPTAAIKASAELLMRGVDRIDGLVNSLLDLVDLQGGMFSFSRLPVPLQRVIDGALARLPASAARRVHVTAAPAVVRCDEARLRRVIYALVDNALKYSPSTSNVELEVTRADGLARVAVIDHGYGIPADRQPHVFEKYFRAHEGTDRDAGGMGVGLFVARDIVQQHDGRIWFESTVDRGTVFYVELPLVPEAT